MKLSWWHREMNLCDWIVVIFMLLAVSCVGSPEPRNPMTRTAPEKRAEVVVKVTPTTVKCLRCDHKDTPKNNPYLTDEEKKILKRTEDD